MGLAGGGEQGGCSLSPCTHSALPCTASGPPATAVGPPAPAACPPPPAARLDHPWIGQHVPTTRGPPGTSAQQQYGGQQHPPQGPRRGGPPARTTPAASPRTGRSKPDRSRTPGSYRSPSPSPSPSPRSLQPPRGPGPAGAGASYAVIHAARSSSPTAAGPQSPPGPGASSSSSRFRAETAGALPHRQVQGGGAEAAGEAGSSPGGQVMMGAEVMMQLELRSRQLLNDLRFKEEEVCVWGGWSGGAGRAGVLCSLTTGFLGQCDAWRRPPSPRPPYFQSYTCTRTCGLTHASKHT